MFSIFDTIDYKKKLHFSKNKSIVLFVLQISVR